VNVRLGSGRALQPIENVLQKEVILVYWADRQYRSNSVLRHYNVLPTTFLLFSGTEKNMGNRWQLCCPGLLVLQVLFGLSPILFGRSDWTTPLQPIQISEPRDIRVL
jgi:hypothetical protein